MESEFFYFIISLLIAGFFSGLIAGLLGVGGGLVIIPLVYYILNYYGYSLDVSMRVAIASSIGVICINSISSIYAHYKLGNIEIEVLKKWYIGIVLGSIFGAILVTIPVVLIGAVSVSG